MGLSCTKRQKQNVEFGQVAKNPTESSDKNVNTNNPNLYMSTETASCPEIDVDPEKQIVIDYPDSLIEPLNDDQDEMSDEQKVDQCWSIISKQVLPDRITTMPQPNVGWKTVRLFVSSTFTDFFYEREILVKKVFPELREWCEQRKLYLVECDLRWGVPRDSTTRDTISTCLEEIDRCHDDNNNQPFFLNMISHRYGWVPDVSDIPPDIVDSYSWVAGVSITTMENLHGVYRCNNPNAIMFLRNPDFLERVPPDLYPRYYDDSNLAQLHLKKMKEKLLEKFPNQVYEYSCEVVEGEASTPDSPQVKIEGLGEFAQRTVEFFKSAIDRMYPHQDEVGTLTERALDDEVQRMFIEQKSERFIGRQRELVLLMDFARGVAGNCLEKLEGTADTRYQRDAVEGGSPILLVDGDPGSGKTALLAKFISRALQANLNVFYHFVGVSPDSFSAPILLKKLTTSLLETAQLDLDIPEDFGSLRKLFSETLQSPELCDRQLLVVIDGMDEMLVRETIGSLSWFPASFPGDIRCVVSLGDDASARNFLEDPPSLRMTLGQLSDVEMKQIIELNLLRFNKRLDSDQLHLLMTNPGCTSPLWIVTVCEELRVFGQFEKVTDRVMSLPDTLHGLLGEIIERLLSEDETRSMEKALCLINFCIHGFPLSECLSLLGDPDSATAVPLIDWAKIRRLLKPYLWTVIIQNQERIFFFHKAMQKAVIEKLVPEGGAETWLTYLVDYYEQKCENIDLIRLEILDYFSQAKLIDRMVKFLRSNKKAEYLSEHSVRNHLQRYRCHATVSTPQSVTLHLCMSCSMKRGAFSTRSFTNSNICLICTKWIPTNIPSGEAKLCQGHAIRTGHPPGPSRCYVCRMMIIGKIPQVKSTTVKLCQQCSFGLQRCCYIGLK